MGFLNCFKTPNGPSPHLPSHDSLCHPSDSKQPISVSTDEKKPPSRLAILRNRFTANRAAQSDRDALLCRPYVDQMVQTTHAFLSDYSSSVHPKACLEFLPYSRLVHRQGFEAIASTKEFCRIRNMETVIFWKHSGVAEAMAKDIKARVEENLGDSKGKTNVEFTVAAKLKTVHCKDEDPTTGWMLIVEARKADAKK